MKKIIFIIFGVIFIFITSSIGLSSTKCLEIDSKDIFIEKNDFNLKENNFAHSIIKNDDGWYYYPPLQNYAPNGMPDFDQKQNNWRDPNTGGWYFCGPVALANVLWYLDCMYSNPIGSPGDGIDICPIVQDYNAPSTPDPGPEYDDHNFNNVNDPESQWDREEMIIGNELIEKAGWYCDTGGIRTGNPDLCGTWPWQMHMGAILWLKDCGLEDYFEIINHTAHLPIDHLDNPDNYINENLRFEQIVHHVMQGHFVNLVIHTYRSNGDFFTGHFVSIAGINIETGEIAYSDPYRDMEQYFSPSQHNDAAKISHDIYQTRNASPSFEIVAHSGWTSYTTLVDAAVIIIPPENGLPVQPLKPMTPQGQLTGEINQEYEYITNTTHPLNKNIYYLFDWGDDTDSGWLGPYTSGEECNTSHIWNTRGAYDIRVKAKDTNDIESPWSDPLSVTMPKHRSYQFPLINWFIQWFDFSFPLLKIIIRGVL